MFYKIEDTGVVETPITQIKPTDTVAGYIKLAELDDVAAALNLSPLAVKECKTDDNQSRAALDVFDDYTFGIMNIVNLQDMKQKRDRVAIFLKKNLFVMVEILDKDTSTSDMFAAAIKRYNTSVTLEKVVYGVMDHMLMGGSERLAETEASILELESRITNNHLDESTNKKLFKMKKTLMTQRTYYTQLVDIGETLEENENSIFHEGNLRYFAVFSARAERLANEAATLSENLVHVREAYEAGINYTMNRTMQFFTVITTVFTPLTLIVGWYGMNFTNMPLINSSFGYPLIIALSAAIVAGTLFWCHKKKYM